MTSLLSTQDVGERYQLLLPLGSGGMGIVYQAVDRLTQHSVALKRVLMSGRGGFDHPMQDFMRVVLAREFQTLASLRHPHIISVLDYGFDQNQQPYFTMDLLENTKTILEAGRALPLRERIDLLIQTLQALVYLHRRGIMHRDLKPANILVCDGIVKVLDFGLAVEHALEGEFVGTIAYMAPEVLAGHAYTPVSDLYAIGVIAYELLTGHYPFETTLGQVQSVVSRIKAPDPDFSVFDSLEDRLPSVSDAVTPIDPNVTIVNDHTIKIDSMPPPTKRFEPLAKSISNRRESSEALTQEHAAVPPTLKIIMQRLITNAPEQRYQRASDVVRDLNIAIGNQTAHETAEARESFLQAARFVGREREMNALTGALEAAINNQGSLWLVSGESGVGKSRLFDEIRIQALVKGALVVRGQAENSGTAYQLWGEPLRRLSLNLELNDADAGILKTIVPDIAELLARNIPDPPPVESGEAETRLMSVVSSLFHRQNRPLVLILEDLHAARGDSLRLLEKIRALSEHLPLLILGNYRDDEENDDLTRFVDAPKLKLHRLNNEEIFALSESILGDIARAPKISSLLMRETEGNVFFLIEIIRALAEEAGQLDQIGLVTLPANILTGGVERILRRRLERVPRHAYPLLQTAALLGREPDLKILTATAPTIDMEQWLFTCAEASILEVREERWRFTHDKLRASIEQALSDDERRDIHHTIAQAIEQVYGHEARYAAILALHWGGAGFTSKELDYLLQSGQYSYELGDNRAAIDAYERYLTRVRQQAESSSSSPERMMESIVQIRMAKALTHLGNYADSTRLLNVVLLVAQDQKLTPLAAEAETYLGRNALLQSDYDEAKVYLQQSLESFRTLNDQVGIANSRMYLGEIAIFQGETALAEDHLIASLILSRSLKDTRAIASALGVLADLLARQQKLADAEKYLRESLALNQQLGNRYIVAGALMQLGILAGFRGDIEESLKQFGDSLNYFREMGNRDAIAAALNNMGFVSVMSKRFSQAQGYFEESLEISLELQNVWGIANTLANLGAVHTENGDYVQAMTRFAEAMRHASEIGVLPLQLEIMVGVARVHFEQGNHENAARLAMFALYHEAVAPDVKANAEALIQRVQEHLQQHILSQLETNVTQTSIETIVEKWMFDNA